MDNDFSSERIRYFAINVEKNAFRRERILSQCATIGIPLEIFNAITPHSIHQVANNYCPRRTAAYCGRPLLETELACALSHISLWRALLADDSADYYVIFEDDADINEGLLEIIAGINLKDIDFIKLSGMRGRRGRIVQTINNQFSLQRLTYGNVGAAAYMLTKKAAAILVPFCQDCRMGIDTLIDRSFDHKVPIHAVSPYPVSAEFCMTGCDPIVSDIGLRHKYLKNTHPMHKIQPRLVRFRTSCMRRIAELRHLLKWH